MSRVLKVSQSDYRLQVQSGGNIILDTGSAVGLVTITGNLDVKGTTTTVESTNTTIKDNIVYINYGQTGNGISSTLDYRAGIQIDRGDLSDAQLVFDEQVTHVDPVLLEDVQGTFVLKTEDGRRSGLQLGTITTDGTTDLLFDMQNYDSILTIVNSTDYETRVTDDNNIPNRKFVTDYVSATGGTANVTNIHYPLVGASQLSRAEATASSIDFVINSYLRAEITALGLSVDNINIFNNTIKNKSTSQLVLTANSNLVEVDSVLALINQGSNPTSSSGKNKIFSKAVVGPGKSGIFFTNTTTSDELVAKNRALLFSMLF